MSRASRLKLIERQDRRLRAVESLAVADLQASGVLPALTRALTDAALGSGDAGRAWRRLEDELVRGLAALMTAAHLQAFSDGVAEIAAERKIKASRLYFAAGTFTTPKLDNAIRSLVSKAQATRRQLEDLAGVYDTAAARILPSAIAEAEQEFAAFGAELTRQGVSVREGRQKVQGWLQSRGLTNARAHLAETLFRTQAQAAFSAGAASVDQDEAVQEILWGYEYVTVGDDRVRPKHQALDGVILPKDDPRWSEIRPPNGYNCRCRVLRIFNEEAPRTTTEPRPKVIDGQIVVPEPDAGFAFNAGEVYRDALRVRNGPTP